MRTAAKLPLFFINMIISIGTDLLLMSRISQEAIRDNDPFLKRAFTTLERQEAQTRNSLHTFYATRFCAKEAIYKAISSIELEFRPHEIEILTDQYGKPYTQFYGDTLNALNQKYHHYIVHVSISYDTDYANSFAILEQL